MLHQVWTIFHFSANISSGPASSLIASSTGCLNFSFGSSELANITAYNQISYDSTKRKGQFCYIWKNTVVDIPNLQDLSGKILNLNFMFWKMCQHIQNFEKDFPFSHSRQNTKIYWVILFKQFKVMGRQIKGKNVQSFLQNVKCWT